jgi:hypothetical protein
MASLNFRKHCGAVARDQQTTELMPIEIRVP